MVKKDKLKCYTLKANDGHIYTTCDDKSVEKPKKKKVRLVLKKPKEAEPKKKKVRLVLKQPKEAATDAMNAIKEVRNISGSPKLKKQFIERLKAEIDRELPDDVLQNIKEFAKPRNDILKFDIFSVWSVGTAIARGLMNGERLGQYDYSDENVYNAFIKKTKELGGDYKNMVYDKNGDAGRGAVAIRGKPRREIVTISNSKNGGLRQVEFVFPISGYGGYINYIISKQPNSKTDEKFNENIHSNNYPSSKKLAAAIRKTKKFDKEYDKMEAMGFKEGYNIYLTGVSSGEINLKKGEMFIPERVFNPSLADDYEFVNFLPLLKK